MVETVWFFVSLAISALTLAYSIFSIFQPYRQNSVLKPFYVIFVGVFLAGVTAFVPSYLHEYDGDSFSNITVALSSIHNAIRFFVVDCDMEFIVTHSDKFPAGIRSFYRVYMDLLMVVSPMLTVGAVLTFFANVLTAFKYNFLHYRKNAYVFTELNDESLALAKSLKRADPHCSIIFTDVFRIEEEGCYEIIEKAKELKALLFKKDVTVANFRFHSKKKKLYFFVMGSDASENMDHVIVLSSPYERKMLHRDETKLGYDYPRGDTRIYVFAAGFCTEQGLSATQPKYLKIRRVNSTQSMIYNLLNTNGMDIFDSAKETDADVYNRATKLFDKERKISALVVGMGLHGTEMVKALSWFCQMHPYSVEINVIDKDPDVSEKFQSSYPELFDCNPPDLTEEDFASGKKYHNGDYTTPGEAHYKISMYGGVDTTLSSFDDMLARFSDTTYVFVALGDDDLNVNVSTKLRILFRRMGTAPVIHTVVYNSNSFEALKNGKTASGQSYNIIPFGDISATYTVEGILNSTLEDKALERHMRYTYHVIEQDGLTGKDREDKIRSSEEEFWRYDYNYRSSIASVLHTEFKKKCGSPGGGKTIDERTEDEKWFYRYLEHQRWNAYVRSEGFTYAPVRDKLAKTHHLLIPFDDLPYEEQIKDDD